MTSEELLKIHPQNLQFPFELRRQSSCTIQLTNNSDTYIAFKVKVTTFKKYCVKPNFGIVTPHSTLDLLVTMLAQKEAPAHMQCNDKFLIQSVITTPETNIEDISSMFKQDSGKIINKKLKVSYVSPPQPPSLAAKQGLDNEGVELDTTSEKLLNIQPQKLEFPFELKKQLSCTIQLTNNTNSYVAFKVKVKAKMVSKYCVRPNAGIVVPHSTCDILVIMQAQNEAPVDTQCKDQFLIQSVVTTSPNATIEDIKSNMNIKKAWNDDVKEQKLEVCYILPSEDNNSQTTTATIIMQKKDLMKAPSYDVDPIDNSRQLRNRESELLETLTKMEAEAKERERQIEEEMKIREDQLHEELNERIQKLDDYMKNLQARLG